MSERINPREVLTYLNELGYTNISAQQLKDFIKDLKKLMKFENRHRKDDSDRENSNPNKNDEMECECDENGAIFESLYNQPTIASKAKVVPRKEKQISVQITKKKKIEIDHPHCVHLLAPSQQNDSQKSKSDKSTEAVEFTTESTIKTVRSESKHSTTTSRQSSSKEPKSRVTFIRPVISKPSINKCDPVALYHHYQNEWKRVKIPGQDNRADLRWAIREKMLGDPKIHPRPLSRKSSCR